MITTIQLNKNVKNMLDKIKRKNETYEQVIVSLINEVEKNKRRNKDVLIESYKEMSKESLKTTKDWSSSDIDWD
ncbi:hypothetical protein ACFLZX_00485 [Nanoarchaeota archaeon]